jgi:hypothetical protein
MTLMTSIARLGIVLGLALLGACGGGGGGGGSSSNGFSISLDKSSVSFSIAKGSPLIHRQDVVATFEGDGVIVGYPPGVAPAPWLFVSQTGSESPTQFTFTLSVDPTSLTSNVSTTLRFLSGKADGSTVVQRDLQVSVEVLQRVSALPETQSVQLEYRLVPSRPSATISVYADGLTWTAASDQPWATLDRSSGAGQQDLQVSLNPTGLSVGPRTARITVTDDRGGTSIARIEFDYRLPVIDSAITSLPVAGVNGAPIEGSFPSETFRLSNGAPAVWSIGTDAPWLLPRLRPANDGQALEYVVDAATTRLSSGNYSGNLSLTAQIGPYAITRTVPVTLALARPTLSSAPTTLNLRGIDPQATSISLPISLNTGVNSYPVTVTATSSNNWLKPMSLPLLASGAGAVVTGRVDPAVIGRGTYNGTLRMTAQINGDAIEQNVPVTFGREQWNLVSGRNGLAFTSAPNLSRLRQDIRISDNAQTGVPFTISTDQPWLNVSGGATTPTTLQVTATASGLPAGLHMGTVTLTPVSPLTEGSEQIRVGLYVSAVDLATDLTIPLAPFAEAIHADPTRPYVYLLDEGGQTLRVLNVYTGASVGLPVALGGVATSIAIATDGQSMYVYIPASRAVQIRQLPDLALIRTLTNASGDFDERAPGSGSEGMQHIAYARPDGYPILMTARAAMVDAQSGNTIRTGVSLLAFGRFRISGDSRYALFKSPGGYRISAGRLDDLVGRATLLGLPEVFPPGIDNAVNFDGSRVYEVGVSTIFVFSIVDDTLKYLQDIPTGDVSYDVEVTPENFLLWSASAARFATPVVKVYDSSPALIGTLTADHNDAVREDSLRISGDGAQALYLYGYSNFSPADSLRSVRLPERALE